MDQRHSDEVFMGEAMVLARQGLGRTSPNPAVGAVVVREERVVGRGYHRRAGEVHAEVAALDDAATGAQGATLYTTLEPCDHTGRTGPCTDPIIRAGVARVVVAMRDPDPQVDGRGIARLQRAGIAVTEDVLADDARRLNEAYIVHRRTGLPFVTLKWAMSLDGKIAARRTAPTPLTGAAARHYAHELRNVYDAVVIGSGTVLADDPLLTCRIPGGRDPLRVVLDARLRTPPRARILSASPGAPAIVIGSREADAGRAAALRAAGAQVVLLPGSRPAWRDVLAALAARGVLSVLVEGGAIVHGLAFTQGPAHKVVVFIAPGLIGSDDAPGPLAAGPPGRPAGLLPLADVSVRPLDEDVVIEGYLPAEPASQRDVLPPILEQVGAAERGGVS